MQKSPSAQPFGGIEVLFDVSRNGGGPGNVGQFRRASQSLDNGPDLLKAPVPVGLLAINLAQSFSDLHPERRNPLLVHQLQVISRRGTASSCG